MLGRRHHRGEERTQPRLGACGHLPNETLNSLVSRTVSGPSAPDLFGDLDCGRHLVGRTRMSLVRSTSSRALACGSSDPSSEAAFIATVACSSALDTDWAEAIAE